MYITCFHQNFFKKLLKKKQEEEAEEEKEEEPSEDIKLLTEIRDLLKKEEEK